MRQNITYIINLKKNKTQRSFLWRAEDLTPLHIALNVTSI